MSLLARGRGNSVLRRRHLERISKKGKWKWTGHDVSRTLGLAGIENDFALLVSRWLIGFSLCCLSCDAVVVKARFVYARYVRICHSLETLDSARPKRSILPAAFGVDSWK